MTTNIKTEGVSYYTFCLSFHEKLDEIPIWF